MGSAFAVLPLPTHSPLAPQQLLLDSARDTRDSMVSGQPVDKATDLHNSVLNELLSQLDTRSKCALMCTCTVAKQLVSKQEHWRELAFDTADEQHGLDPSVLFSLLGRSHGSCEVIQLAR
jgi:hypothetical protein